MQCDTCNINRRICVVNLTLRIVAARPNTTDNNDKGRRTLEWPHCNLHNGQGHSVGRPTNKQTGKQQKYYWKDVL